MEDSDTGKISGLENQERKNSAERRQPFRKLSKVVSTYKRPFKEKRKDRRDRDSRRLFSRESSREVPEGIQNEEEPEEDAENEDGEDGGQKRPPWMDDYIEEDEYNNFRLNYFNSRAANTCSSRFCYTCKNNRFINRIPFIEGKDKMKWARRAFFMSTEKIFPGFIKRSGLQNSGVRESVGVKLRTSVSLKMCLLAHSYFIPVWFLGFLLTQEFATASLKPLHSYVHTSLTYVSVATDICRLYAGILSNTKDDMQMLALYWMGTVVLQTPIMCFIFATHAFSKYLLPFNVAMDIVLGTILILEIWFGFWHLKGLVSSEIQLLYLARQMNEMSSLWSRTRHFKPKTVNCPNRGPYVDWSTSDEGFSSGNNSDKPRMTRHRGDKKGKYLRRNSLSASSFKDKRRRWKA